MHAPREIRIHILPATARWIAVAVLAISAGCVVVDWVDSEFSYSKVINARPVPAFEVTPEAPGARYLRFEAVGDFGTGAAGERDVAASMARKAKADSISFVLVLGDNFYESGVESVTDDQWQTAFEKVFDQPALNVPFYAVLGNHDYRSNPQAQVDYTRLSTRWKMPERYFSFRHAIDDSTSLEVFCLDTNPLAYLSQSEAKSLSDTSEAKRQLVWLQERLRQSTAQWRIVIGHHTIYSGGEHGDNGTLRLLLEPIFVDGGVDFYVCGHDHDLELLKPVRGVTYIVSGAGAKHRDVRWRDNTVYAATNLGFTFFRMSRSEVVVEFLTRGGTIDYAHTFTKQGG
ncbi:MAG TPA: tartrate-resistant acid phosphatase type 5 family protein [Bacteroidota bacterium]|nr:tartrate-resistant acid phosphatase type 5 family protein [Bacteroidota bacterium]